jgi:hypothetical protein
MWFAVAAIVVGTLFLIWRFRLDAELVCWVIAEASRKSKVPTGKWAVEPNWRGAWTIYQEFYFSEERQLTFIGRVKDRSKIPQDVIGYRDRLNAIKTRTIPFAEESETGGPNPA